MGLNWNGAGLRRGWAEAGRLEGGAGAREAGVVEGGEVVIEGFTAADFENVAVFLEEQFAGAEFAVVVEAHGASVGAGVVDNQDITAFNGGQAAVDGEFVVVFAEAAHDVVGGLCP